MNNITIAIIAIAFGVATTFTMSFIVYMMALIMTGGN
jgi:hypothetical protein